MAGLAANARGRFVCAEYNSWDSYESKGVVKPAGESLNISVLTGTDDAPLLIRIWTASEDMHRARAACAGLKFGDHVDFLVSPGASKSYRFLDRMPEPAGAKN
jgi:hypothetical protein